MTKNTHTLRGLKSQKHIDQVLYNLRVYITQYRVPQPQLLRETTSQLIASNIGPRNAFYHKIQNDIYWYIYRQVEYLIDLEIQQEQELQTLKKKKQKNILQLRHPQNPQKSEIPHHHTLVDPYVPFLIYHLFLLALLASYHPPP